MWLGEAQFCNKCFFRLWNGSRVGRTSGRCKTPHTTTCRPVGELMWYLHLRPSPVSPSAHAFHGQKTLFYEDCELCVSVQVPVRALSLVCARELLQCWGHDGPSSSQFCWMSSRRPVRAAVLGSHTAMVLPCALVEWWECSALLVPPALSARKTCV